MCVLGLGGSREREREREEKRREEKGGGSEAEITRGKKVAQEFQTRRKMCGTTGCKAYTETKVGFLSIH